jgi:two-component system chemotaxis response regulator CheB
MKRLRVLVVEDSLTVRRYLCDVLSSDPDIEIVGEAEDGKRAVELCQALAPDVITLDMFLPVMSGLSATEYIMAHFPTPILIVSSSVNRGDLFKMYDALAAGAVDVLEKPAGDASDAGWDQKFLAAVKLVAKIKVITHPRARLGLLGRPTQHPAPLPAPARRGGEKVVAIGASTGGPGALVEVLQAIPKPFPLPVLVVLHIGELFAGALADWLGDQTQHRVEYARGGEPLADTAGRIVLAPPGQHLIIKNGELRLTRDPERHSCRPAVDSLFDSIASELAPGALACLLTGMGRDGAEGLLRIRRAGGRTIAQDEATSIVYGMPREAALLGAAERVLPLSGIGPAIASWGGAG